MTNNSKVNDKLWPVLPYPCSYEAALDTLTKQELTILRTNLRVKNVSQLNKTALAAKLAEVIPHHMGNTMNYWDEQRFSHFRTVLSKQGYSTNNYMDMKQAAYFGNRGALFQATVEGRKGLVMPQQLLQFIQASGLPADEQRIRMNTELISLVRGMLYFYGVLSLDALMELLPKYMDASLSADEVRDVLLDACEYYSDFEYKDGIGFYSILVKNPAAIREVQEKQYADLAYYPYTKAELLQASKEDYFERHAQFNDFIRFILEHYEMNRSDAEAVIIRCILEAKNGGNIQSVLNVLQESVEIPEGQYANQLFNKLAAVLNHSTQWALKGHSPKGLPQNQSDAQSGATVADEAKKKVGRNDPCPCGSGKKFKKCCMA